MDMKEQRKDSRAAWTKPISKEEWRQFLSHNFNDPARKNAYAIIREHVCESQHQPLSITEIGFGQGYDYVHGFADLCGVGVLKYTGYDVTPQFVEYAREDYGPIFNVGTFDSLNNRWCDITYTAKTLEHQHPDEYEGCLKAMLSATAELCVIVWFKAPAVREKMYWCQRDGFNHEGAWGNIYSKTKIYMIAHLCGFTTEDIPVVGQRHVYVMRRKSQ